MLPPQGGTSLGRLLCDISNNSCEGDYQKFGLINVSKKQKKKSQGIQTPLLHIISTNLVQTLSIPKYVLDLPTFPSNPDLT